MDGNEIKGIGEEYFVTTVPTASDNPEIKSNTEKKKQSNLDNPIRLLIRDVNLLRETSTTNILKTTLFGEPAESVLIFGDLFVYKRIERFKKGIYLLDDGTARITIHYNHNHRIIKENVKLINLIENKMFQAKENIGGLNQYSAETLNAMCRIKQIGTDRVHQQQKYFENCKAYVIGTPFISKASELCISAKHIYSVKVSHDDNDEICWNLTLANLYENEYDLKKI